MSEKLYLLTSSCQQRYQIGMVHQLDCIFIILIYDSSPRLNYILWLQDLIDATSGGRRDGYDPEREVIGLDVYISFEALNPP